MELGRDVVAMELPTTGSPSVEVIMSPANNFYNFRHLSELEKEAKGGYLEGAVIAKGVPDHRIDRVELELVENPNYDVHPNFLFVTPNKRKCLTSQGKAQTKMTTDDCFITVFKKEDRWTVGKTSYSDQFDVPLKNASELQLGKDSLQVTIVKPNQKSEHKTPGLFLRPVLEAKLKRRNEGSTSTDEKAKWFASAKSSRDGYDDRGSLFKVFLAATFILDDGTRLRGVSQRPLLNKGTFKVDVDEVGPKRICQHGPSEIFVIMKPIKIFAKDTINFCLEINGLEIVPEVKKYSQGTVYKLTFNNIQSAGPTRGCLKFWNLRDFVLSEEISVEPHITGGRCWCEMHKLNDQVSESGPTKRMKIASDNSDEFQRYHYDVFSPDEIFDANPRDLMTLSGDDIPLLIPTDGAIGSSRARGLPQRSWPVTPHVRYEDQDGDRSEWLDHVMIVVKIGLIIPIGFLVKKYLEK